MKRHTPEILTGLGIAGMISTTILAVKATPKALELIEDEKREINRQIIKEATRNGYDQAPQIDKLKPFDVVKVTWKCYIPAAATGTVSLLCLIGASSVNVRRNAALATAYTLSETALKEYKDKVIETVGEKKEQEVRDAIAKDKIEQNPVKTNEIIFTDKGDTLCFDPLSGRYFKSDIDSIKKALNESNRLLLSNSRFSLNDFYDEIGLEDTKIGYDLGWDINRGLIELSFSSQLTKDGTPCVVMDFATPPTYDYDKWL